ncbi:DUF3108 domain-containing protein [Mangrovimicrobium sediminis]|uniref:DUF3108 domain-containing protein n=1 Tax=Mangrovimicrobium sediminis TaxID=2562682 RepID=A0A4Z0LV53_9GAMM|nr:DUF3108 domain-containing protein [Haliea sp. SAOS-164]TGD71171.1 DUF3108 domain-containing protein [Haliea sp. SAOS-164]
MTRPCTRALQALLLGVALVPGLLWANPAATPLQPYSAEYKTMAHGMELTLQRQLESNADGSYTLTNGGKIMVVGFHEVSVFRVDGTEVVPRSYVYQGSGLINRRREVHFTQGADTLRSLYKGKWYELPYTEGTLDRMSQLEQVRLLLLNRDDPRGDIPVRVADARKIKSYVLEFVAEETLDTPLGALRTLHFRREHDNPERKSDMWLAPELDYLMVRTVHIEDGNPVEMILTSASLGDPAQDAGQAATGR